MVRPKGPLVRLRRALLYVVLSAIALTTLFPFALMILTSLRTGGAIITTLSRARRSGGGSSS